MSGNVYTLKYEGITRKLKESQLQPYWIGKFFNLFPDSIVLIGSDGSAEVPDDGVFSLEYYLDYEVLKWTTVHLCKVNHSQNL